MTKTVDEMLNEARRNIDIDQKIAVRYGVANKPLEDKIRVSTWYGMAVSSPAYINYRKAQKETNSYIIKAAATLIAAAVALAFMLARSGL